MTGRKGSRLLALSALLVFVGAGAKLLAQSDNTTQSNSASSSPQSADSRNQAADSTVTGDQLQALPIPGRNWQDFIDPHAPGSSDNSDREDSSHTSGRATPVTLDGAPTGLAFGNTKKRRGDGGSLTTPGVSELAIHTVRVAGADTESMDGHIAGSHANIETKRGASALHGQGFLFDRENLWGAQNPFTQWTQQSAPATGIAVPVFTPEPYTPSDREIIWGAGAGGQIRRSKLFWFAAIDNNLRNDPGVSTVKHPDSFFAQPSNDQMQVLSARLALYSANPVAAGVTAYSGMLQTLDGLLGPAERTSTQLNGFVRLDWDANERNKFTLEGTGANWNAPGGGLTRASESYGNHSYGSSRASDQLFLARWQAFTA